MWCRWWRIRSRRRRRSSRVMIRWRRRIMRRKRRVRRIVRRRSRRRRIYCFPLSSSLHFFKFIEHCLDVRMFVQ